MYIIVAVIFIYVLFILLLIVFWNKPEKSDSRTEPIPVALSVIIPVRDEPGLPLLLKDLKEQTFPAYEIIIVDDHSVTPVMQSSYGEIVISLNGDKTGKKAALTEGILRSTGNIIVTLDADCRVSSGFLYNIAQEFKHYNIKLSPGIIRYTPVSNIFEKMQAMETAALMGAGVALHHLGITSLSNGANLAFEKELWKEIGGYKSHAHLPSGDDEFFVQEVASKYPDKVRFRTNVDDVVSTFPNKTFSSFFHQRLRWAGKWRKYEDIKIKGVALLTFLFHMIICSGLITLFSNGTPILYGIFLSKFILEGVLIFRVSRRLGQHFYIMEVFLLQFIYSPYVVFFGVVANFIPFNWKGRSFSH